MASTVTQQRPLSKIALNVPEVSSPACFSKAMLLATCWRLPLLVALSIPHLMDGVRCTGSALLCRCLSLGSAYVSSPNARMTARILTDLPGLGETDSYMERKRLRAAGDSAGKTFVAEGKVALKRHWMLLIYMVLLMAGFNFMSHGSQDLYPTMLENQYQFSSDAVTVTQVVANLGAMTGGTVVGYLSQMLGRRFSIIYISVVGGALLYPYSFTGSEKVAAAAFFEQFCVQGAWGVIPIHLMELSPGGYRTFVVGTSYQLGNLISSASSTIEATIGERFPLPSITKDGETVERYAYGKVM